MGRSPWLDKGDTVLNSHVPSYVYTEQKRRGQGLCVQARTRQPTRHMHIPRGAVTHAPTTNCSRRRAHFSALGSRGRLSRFCGASVQARPPAGCGRPAPLQDLQRPVCLSLLLERVARLYDLLVGEDLLALGPLLPIGNDLDADSSSGPQMTKLDAVRSRAKTWMGLYRNSYFGRNLVMRAKYFGSLCYWLYTLPMSKDNASRKVPSRH